MSENYGPKMTGLQYEALCRHAISRIYGMPVDQIHGGHLAGMSNRRQKLRHQIDLEPLKACLRTRQSWAS
ncbi:MAG TPA: hypothetical protein VIM11_00050 [Tepidisphaeraceae bacterium]